MSASVSTRGETRPPSGTDVVVVLTNLPDREMALKLANALVERRVAACVNVLCACDSVYRWKGAVEQASEVPVLVKSTTDSWPALEKAILELHPYDLPEIVCLPVVAGLGAYLDWIRAETSDSALAAR